MDTINVNGETYTKVPDEISLFGRTYLLADDTIPEPLDVSDWHPIEPDYRITLREYMTHSIQKTPSVTSPDWAKS